MGLFWCKKINIAYNYGHSQVCWNNGHYVILLSFISSSFLSFFRRLISEAARSIVTKLCRMSDAALITQIYKIPSENWGPSQKKNWRPPKHQNFGFFAT